MLPQFSQGTAYEPQSQSFAAGTSPAFSAQSNACALLGLPVEALSILILPERIPVVLLGEGVERLGGVRVIVGDCLRPRPVLRRFLTFEFATSAWHSSCDAAPIALTDFGTPQSFACCGRGQSPRVPAQPASCRLSPSVRLRACVRCGCRRFLLDRPPWPGSGPP